MIPKPINHFEVEGYEVRFLQSAPVTVCVIRSLNDRSQKYTGVAVCHPSDVWDEAVGRHKALKDTLENGTQNITGSSDIVWVNNAASGIIIEYMSKQIDTLRSERDEWKADAEQLAKIADRLKFSFTDEYREEIYATLDTHRALMEKEGK
jgi:hypothetical protein